MSKTRGRAKGAGGNVRMKKYPSILDYLEAHHKTVFELINEAGMKGALIPRRGGSKTFLIPDAKLQANIRKVLESDNAENATDMIGSLVLNDLLVTPEDFAKRKDDIPNLLGKALIVKTVAKDKVTIDNGTLVPDTKFKPFSRQGTLQRGNIAVWKLTGEVEYEKAPKATYKYLKGGGGRRGGKKRGGNDAPLGGSDAGDADLVQLRKDTYEKEIEYMREGSNKSRVLTETVRILGGLEGARRDLAAGVCTGFFYADFEILTNTSLLSSSEIMAAHSKGYNSDISQYASVVNTARTKNANYSGFVSALSNAVLSITEQKGDKFGPGRVCDLIRKYDNSGSLKGVKGHNDAVLEFFKANPGWHQAKSELAYYIKEMHKKVSGSLTSEDKVKEFTNYVQIMYSRPVNRFNPQQELRTSMVYNTVLTDPSVTKALNDIYSADIPDVSSYTGGNDGEEVEMDDDDFKKQCHQYIKGLTGEEIQKIQNSLD